MGGPCTIQPPDGATGAAALKRRAPPCTDNFHLAPFEYDGQIWHSCEHAYQACKFPRGSDMRARLARLAPRDGDSGRAFGVHVWQLGQAHPEAVRVDWSVVKVRIMYECNVAKYAAHENLREDLLSTAGSRLYGPQSTKWTHAGQEHAWQKWNGWIQMRIREELLDPSARVATLLEEMVAHFEAYGNIDAGETKKPQAPQEPNAAVRYENGGWSETCTGPGDAKAEPPLYAGVDQEALVLNPVPSSCVRVVALYDDVREESGVRVHWKVGEQDVDVRKEDGSFGKVGGLRDRVRWHESPEIAGNPRVSIRVFEDYRHCALRPDFDEEPGTVPFLDPELSLEGLAGKTVFVGFAALLD